MTDMLEAVDHLHSYGVLLGRYVRGHANVWFFFLTPPPSAVRKKTWPSLFFSIIFSALKTLPSMFLLEPSCSYCICRPLGISAKMGMSESPLLFLVAIRAPKLKTWGSRTNA